MSFNQYQNYSRNVRPENSTYGETNYQRSNASYDYTRQQLQLQQQQPSVITSSPYVSSSSSSSSDPRNKKTQIYMGELDPTWTEATIKSIWKSLGEELINVKLIWNKNLGLNQGYCFIEFPSEQHASNALLKNGINIPEFPRKKVKLNWTSSSSASLQGSSNSGQVPSTSTNYSVFVGDLAANVTEGQLFDLFISRFQSTCHAKIVHDPVTRASKCYGFVKFNDLRDQQRALVEMQGIFLNGRAIKIGTTTGGSAHTNTDNNALAPNIANSGGKSRFQGTTTNSPSSPANIGRGNTSNYRLTSLSSQFIFPVQQQPPLNHFTDPNNTTVFVGGLSSMVTEEQLRHCFQPFGTIIYVKIPIGKGCGFVQYFDRISAETAILRMQGFPIGNSRIRLSWGRSSRQQGQALAQPVLQEPIYGYVPNPDVPNTFNSTNTSNIDRNNYLPGFQELRYSNLPTNDTISNHNNSIIDNNVTTQNDISKNGISAYDRLERGSNGFTFI
ncbi:Nam8p NDAI_0C01820 [Naumovozyma dairenensis CBS 421]|uniref:RRM domain-containing protein n=1 Tax=Naumovozyma dairenensis (strain ATCC 10597 / BCRC 20456 / CBS 421 / NBRC 0211 / NRRL Y-12639) TaxID=1071378 RepID=G0W7T2_NAUDC|nr:hypothetical protein NDAI_0C01820 [Naumovozyma dairenensis CBS 421]CCD23843.1 hypothetical protein NDAI_0C01820 [Naumovozyma dairenensis CBS 421]